jgi:AraC family transcriptional regulator of adaptative response / DNA-3-methyladenine glycosylase II
VLAALDPDSCYRALSARDGRFDGHFFVGVTTTGVYCRPICPARTPRRDRVRFFRLAAEAERDGFRACFRCRPELAPGAAPVDAVSRVARAALARIEAGALNDGGVSELAHELALGERQLRRALARELGVSPMELAGTRRLLVAKQLLAETALPVTEIAFAAGFQSLRRMNAAFRARFGASPSAVRRAAPAGGADDAVVVNLGFRPPLAWDALLRFLRDHALPGVEEVTDDVYRRTVTLGEASGWITVGPPAASALPVAIAAPLTRALVPILARVRSLFDLDADPAVLAACFAGDGALGPRWGRRPGLRVPGGFDGFELALRTVLGQQVSVRGANTLAGRVVQALGAEAKTPFPALTHASPTPAAVRRAGAAGIQRLGILPARARTLEALAAAVANGLRLDAGADAEAARVRLRAIPGIGPWTAEVIAMRALRDPDAFPDGDLGLRRAFGGDAAALRAAAEHWRPWRATAAQLLWEG